MTSKSLKIFIVDDDDSLLRSIRRLMVSAGYRDVETYSSCEEFLASAKLKERCLLILDLKFPGMGGIDLCHHLRKSGGNVHIVFISAHDNELRRAKAECGEALAFLSKPFNGKDIFAAIKSTAVA